MNYPSIKTIEAGLKVTRLQAVEIRQSMELFSHGKTDYSIMRTIDGILGTHGVEYIDGSGTNGTNGMDYCNTGDTYDTTVLFDCKAQRFVIGSWGDIVEKYPNRFKD